MNLNILASLLAHEPLIHADHVGHAEIPDFCIDTRVLTPGAVYVAMVGEHFDGHDFVKEAEAKGAVAVVVSRETAGVRIPQLVVPDTIQALAAIATAHRLTIACPVIALTGSNGKTTVKEMTAAILPAPSHATKGNLNNHLGAPLSVLALKKQHRYAVFELGANHAGEIAHTVAIVRPDVTLINNIAPAHIAGFGSIDGVARAKGELHQGLSASGIAVINDDDAYAHFWDELLADKKILRFSASHPSDVCAQNVRMDAQGCGHFTLIAAGASVEVDLQVPGAHNVQNALAAAACCSALGVALTDIQHGLNHFRGVSGRMTVLPGKNHATVIDDTYNANLRSVLTALAVLAQRPGKKIFVFGDMGELGAWTAQHHQEVGTAARQLGIDMLLSCGSHSALAAQAFGLGGRHFLTKAELVPHVLEELAPNTTVLVKGSRSSAMEDIVHKLLLEEEPSCFTG
ncbi:MAG: UDP-N-acetylmuramoyl-tripeptide--D-alanyl-D-alanine ligase [Legionellales bacterium]